MTTTTLRTGTSKRAIARSTFVNHFKSHSISNCFWLVWCTWLMLIAFCVCCLFCGSVICINLVGLVLLQYSIFLQVCLCLSVCLSVSLWLWWSICVCLSFCLTVYQSMISIHLSPWSCGSHSIPQAYCLSFLSWMSTLCAVSLLSLMSSQMFFF